MPKIQNEDVKLLKTIGSSILDNLKILATLEYSGDKLSYEYRSVLNSMIASIDFENIIIDRLGNEYTNLIDIIADLLDDNLNNIDNFTDSLDVIINGNDNELITKRLINKLYSKLINYNSDIINVRTKAVVLNRETNEIESFPAASIINVNKAIQNDFLNAFISILENSLNDPKYQNSEDYLIKIKYYLGYIFENLETNLIKANYEVANEFYLTAQNYSEYYKIPHKIFNAIKNNFSEDLILYNSVNVELLDNYSLNDKNVLDIIRFRLILIRTALIFAKNNRKEQIIKESLDVIEKRKMFNDPNIKSGHILIDSLEDHEQDLKMARVVSLKPTKRESN